MTRVTRVALLSLLLPTLLGAQEYRVRLESGISSVAWRGMELDSVRPEQVTLTPGGGFLTPEGHLATCSVNQCRYFRPGLIFNAAPWVSHADLSLWGLGITGLSARASLRYATEVGEAAWPTTEPALQLREAYLEYAGSALQARLGRQLLFSRLGAYGLDGGRLAWTAGSTGLEAAGYLGWGLARGIALPVTDPALNPLDDFQPRDRQVVAGLDVGWRGPRLDVRAEYRREVDPAVDYFVSERAAGSVVLGPFAGARLAGGVVYDLAFGQVGSAEATASWRGGRWGFTAGARRSRPLFDLWTIWGAFSPVGYNAYHGSVDVRAFAGLGFHGRAEWYAYDNPGAETGLVTVEDDGWRSEWLVRWSHDGPWSAHVGQDAEFGPGAAYLGWRAGVGFDPSERIGFSAQFVTGRRPLEFRFSDAVVTMFGAQARWQPDPRWRLDLSASSYQQGDERPDASAIDWDQLRLSARMTFLLGSSADRLPLPRAVRRGQGGGP